MRRWFKRELEQLRQFAELQQDGLLVVDVLHEGDARPSFRTLLQLDGDVLSSIASSALTDPDFAAAHARHLQHIGERLRMPTDRLRQWSLWASVIVSCTGAVVSGVVVDVIGPASSTWHDRWILLGSALGAGIGLPLGHKLLFWVVGRLIRKYADDLAGQVDG